MSIKKQEFYEGAALHLLVRSGKVESLRYQSPFFLVNGSIMVLLKYSTRPRSPWAFTFAPQEQMLLDQKALAGRLYIALVCGSDGVVAINYEMFAQLVATKGMAARIACFRDFGEHYQVSGPAGVLDRKVSRSFWPRILDVQQGVVA